MTRKLFIEELRAIAGAHHKSGHHVPPGQAKKNDCPEFTTLACNEEIGCTTPC